MAICMDKEYEISFTQSHPKRIPTAKQFREIQGAHSLAVGARTGCYHAPMADAAALVPPEARAATRKVDEYPYSDGRILVDADPHANAIVAMRNQLQTHFEDSPDIYVAGSLAVFYRQGDKEAVVAPDVFVALGIENRERKSYKIWEEGGVVPAFVVEVASPSTSSRDGTSKRTIYERIGVREYWRFDPEAIQVPQGIEGWRLEGASYERMRARRQADGVRWYRSAVLGLDLRTDGRLLRFRDPLLGQDLLTHSEESRARHIAERRADRAERRAEAERAARREAERERGELNRRILELEERLRNSG